MNPTENTTDLIKQAVANSRLGQLNFGMITLSARKDDGIGWLACDGRELSREQYPELFAAIGTTFGDGDGETTFNIPTLPNPAENIRYIIRASRA